VFIREKKKKRGGYFFVFKGVGFVPEITESTI